MVCENTRLLQDNIVFFESVMICFKPGPSTHVFTRLILLGGGFCRSARDKHDLHSIRSDAKVKGIAFPCVHSSSHSPGKVFAEVYVATFRNLFELCYMVHRLPPLRFRFTFATPTCDWVGEDVKIHVSPCDMQSLLDIETNI